MRKLLFVALLFTPFVSFAQTSIYPSSHPVCTGGDLFNIITGVRCPNTLLTQQQQIDTVQTQIDTVRTKVQNCIQNNLQSDDCLQASKEQFAIQAHVDALTQVQKDTEPIIEVPVDYTSVIDFNKIDPQLLAKYANTVSSITGISADKILASVKGKGGGGCYFNASNGMVSNSQGKQVVTRSITNSGPYLKSIVKSLDLDTKKIPISCDGTIGAGMFLPSSWIILSQSRTNPSLGYAINSTNELLNPWNPQDIMLVEGIYLASVKKTVH